MSAYTVCLEVWMGLMLDIHNPQSMIWGCGSLNIYGEDVLSHETVIWVCTFNTCVQCVVISHASGWGMILELWASKTSHLAMQFQILHHTVRNNLSEAWLLEYIHSCGNRLDLHTMCELDWLSSLCPNQVIGNQAALRLLLQTWFIYALL